MKTRTEFKLLGKGLVYCWRGSLVDFVKDINEFILPILEDNIIVEFNNRQITVYEYDDAESIYIKLWKALYGA